jgi:hypothetical protein
MNENERMDYGGFGGELDEYSIAGKTQEKTMTEETGSMTMAHVSKINLERCKVWHVDGIREWSALEWAGAMCGEAGEAANIAKKLKRLDEGHAGKNRGESWKSLTPAVLQRGYAKEIGDTYLYLDLMAQREGLTLEECVRHAFNVTSEKEGLPQRL